MKKTQTQKTLQIKELIDKLKNKSCNYIEYLCDYDNSCICDAFHEIADNNTSIYYCDIINYLKDHVDEVNNIIIVTAGTESTETYTRQRNMLNAIVLLTNCIAILITRLNCMRLMCCKIMV